MGGALVATPLGNINLKLLLSIVKLMNLPMDQKIASFNKLQRALANGSSSTYCLRLWSNFIRLRDDYRCVVCESRENLHAHHIIRKSFIPKVQYQTGNGITLCEICHKEPHRLFNKRPDFDLPMDEQNGENIDLIVSLFSYLIDDAKTRKQLNDTYYFLSDELLMNFKALQGISRDIPFPGSRIEQAYLIWRQTPRPLFNAILQANGFSLPDDFIQMSPFTLFMKSK